MSIISASTTSTTAYKVTADTTGTLVLQTGASPTTAMTIDGSQNVTLAGNITLNNGAADGAQLTLASSGFSNWNIDNFSGNFRWYYNATEYMRLDASGNLGIGVTSPSHKIDVSGNIQVRAGNNLYLVNSSGSAYVGLNSPADSVLAFYRGSTESARIDSSGNLLVGTTSTTIGTANFGISLNSNGSLLNSRNVNGASAVMQVYGNAGEFRVYGNGTYATISDARIKENVVDATPKLQDLMGVRIVNYNIIGDDQKQLGVIAQELAEVFPSLVDNGESEDDTKAVRYSVFVPMLIKSIQEQQAIIETLTNRITALENK